jgi:hypothetical protein
MLLAAIFSLETILVVICLLLLTGGLVRITMRRQTEILKEYLQPEHLQVEQLIMRSEKVSPHHDENKQPPDSQETP